MTLDEKAALCGCPFSFLTAAVPRLKIPSVDLGEGLCSASPQMSGYACAFDGKLFFELGKKALLDALKNNRAVTAKINLGLMREPFTEGSEKLLSEEPAVVAALYERFLCGAGGGAVACGFLPGGDFDERTVDGRAREEIYYYPLYALSAALSGVLIGGGTLNGEKLAESKEFFRSVTAALNAGAAVFHLPGTVDDFARSLDAGGGFLPGMSKAASESVKRAVVNGTLAEAKLDRAVTRTLAFVLEFLERQKNPPAMTADFYDADRAAAYKSVVLLKNDGFLPVSGGERFFVCGRVPADIKTALKEKTNAVFAAEPAPGVKNVLIAASPRPYELGDLSAYSAVLFVPQIFENTPEALTDILTGKTSPSGKLPFTWAVNADAYPAALNKRARARGTFCYESVINGSRYFARNPLAAEFPFGHGLSYLKLEIKKPKADLNAETVDLDFTLKNDSEFDGDAVIFVFDDADDKNVFGLTMRPVAFERVFISAKSEKSVAVSVKKSLFDVYSPDLKRRITPGGKHTLRIGFSCFDIAAKTTVSFRKPDAPFGETLSKKALPSYYADGAFAPSGTEIERVVGAPLTVKQPLQAPKPSANKDSLLRSVNKKIAKQLRRDSSLDLSHLSSSALETILRDPK
jgi:hypothetical protein